MSNVPAVPEQAKPSAGLARVSSQDTDSWVEVMRPILALAEKVYDTDFVPRGLRGSAPATAAAMLYGREVGLPPMTALNMTHVVEGKPGISAEGMRALVYAAGHEIEFVETTGATCTMRARRSGGERWTDLTWTLDMARVAGVTGKNNWKSYPRAMLQARCTTELCRMVFADVIHGFRSVEELEDMAEPDGGGGSAPAAGPGGTTAVRRRRASKKPPAVPPAQQTPTPALTGPPLPGEPGFESPGGEDGGSAPESVEPPHDAPHPESEQTSADGADDGSSAGHVEESGEDIEDPPADVVDGETVEQPADAHTVDGPGDDAGPGPADSPGEVGDDKASASPPSPRGATRAQLRMLEASLTERGIDAKDREERHMVASKILGFEVESFSDLSSGNTSTVIDTLARTESREQLWALLDAIDGGES